MPRVGYKSVTINANLYARIEKKLAKSDSISISKFVEHAIEVQLEYDSGSRRRHNRHQGDSRPF